MCLKDEDKGTTVFNIRFLTCLMIKQKQRTSFMAEERYIHLHIQKMLISVKKVCKKGSRWTNEQLLIDEMAIRNCKFSLNCVH